MYTTPRGRSSQCKTGRTNAASGSIAPQSSALAHPNFGFDCGELIGCRFRTSEWTLAARWMRGMDDGSARRGAQVGRRRRTAGGIEYKRRAGRSVATSASLTSLPLLLSKAPSLVVTSANPLRIPSHHCTSSLSIPMLTTPSRLVYHLGYSLQW